jgi:hypothetical protein
MLHTIHTKAGKVTILSVLLGIVAVFTVFIFDAQHGGHIQRATAQDYATTSVFVQNIPPSWTALAVENPASTTTSPTNVGSAVTWEATGTDGNGEVYYLLVCKDATAPTARQNLSPLCNGAGQWAVSTSTNSGTPATASYTASSTDVLETYQWYAWICDANPGVPGCNATYSGHETSAANKSPFNVNHNPSFTSFTVQSSVLPYGTATWNATSSDSDSTGGNDTVKLYVCTTSNFTAGVGCDDGTWATSTLSASNPSASGVINGGGPALPIQDGSYGAYGFIVDQHDLVATGATQGSNAPLTVLNATPVVTNVAFATSTLELTVEQGETTGFQLTMDVTDDNSCVANASTTAEIQSADLNVYRSGVASTSCSDFATHFDENDCYTSNAPGSRWTVSCSQNAGTCGGPLDDTVTWTCDFSLFYVADPTTQGGVGTESPYWVLGENWLATAFAVDEAATSSLVQTAVGADVEQFLQFNVGTSSIAYGSFQPGNGNASTTRPTIMYATGNVGLDQNLQGTDMCPDTIYPACSGFGTSTIDAPFQHFAASIVGYGTGIQLLSTTTRELELNVNKTTATSSPQSGTTYWGILVPGTLTVSGDYIGVNTFYGITAETADW